MFAGLPTTSLPIIRLFDSPFLFNIPAYQRPYSWTVKEAGQLLEDLVIAAGLDDHETASPDYFIGTILLLDPEADVVSPPPPYGGPRVFEVVDGQQRLVTIAILAAVLRDLEDADADRTEDGVRLADQLHAMIALGPDDRDITGRRSRIVLRDNEQRYLERRVVRRELKSVGLALEFGSDGLEMAAVREHLAAEIDHLSDAERRSLSRYLVDFCHVVVIISRDIDRAHRLFTVLNERGKPLDRKDIIKAEVLRGVPSDAAPAALMRWENAHAALGGEFEAFLGHLRLIHGLQRLPIISGVRSLVRAMGSERFLAEQLSPLAEAFDRVRTFASGPEAASHARLTAALISLNRLGKSDWVPAAIVAMTQFPSAPEQATRLMCEIERFSYLLRVLCYGAGKRQRRFAAVIQAIRSSPDGALNSPAWDITRDEQRTIAFHLKDLHRRNPGMSKLVLMRIEDEMAGQSLPIDPGKLTVEHLLPLRPAATSDWKRQVVDAEQRAYCTASLGNLVLVSERQNDKAKNKDFGDKLAIYREVEPGSPPLVLNADVVGSAEWLAADITARETRLLEVIARIWRIDLGPPPRTVRMFG